MIFRLALSIRWQFNLFFSNFFSGMEAIFSFVYLKSEDLCSLFRIFFSQVHTQSQIVSDRRQIFQIFEQLLRFKMKHILPLGSEFVLSFIQAVDAEKDPINMNLIFSLWPLVLKEFRSVICLFFLHIIAKVVVV